MPNLRSSRYERHERAGETEQSDGQTASTSKNAVVETVLVIRVNEKGTVAGAEETSPTYLLHRQTIIGTVRNRNHSAEKNTERRNEVAGRKKEVKEKKTVMTTTRQVRV